jgi:hypothetical protein
MEGEKIGTDLLQTKNIPFAANNKNRTIQNHRKKT